MENGAVLIACDTAPGLSGAAVQGLPIVWVRSMSLMTATTLATSYPDWQEYTGLPVVRDRRTGRTSRPRGEESDRIVVRPSAELEAFLGAARAPLPEPLQGLRQRGGGSVPVGPLVAFIEHELIAVRSISYRNPAAITAFVGTIATALVTRFDALLDPSGYVRAVRASHRAKAWQSGVDGRKAAIELSLGFPSGAYLEHRLAEGATVREVVEELEDVSPAAQHIPIKQEARELVAWSVYEPSWEAHPRGESIESTSEMTLAEKIVRTETDARALHGLASLDSVIEALPDDGDGLFAPPE